MNEVNGGVTPPLDHASIEELLRTKGPERWRQRIEVVPGSGIYTTDEPLYPEDMGERLTRFGLSPSDMAGRRVLDIGADAGQFSFYLEECGADVTALDISDPRSTGFALLQELRGSSVRYVQASVYDLDPVDVGRFDLIAFYGIFYHLKHPLLAFERMASVSRDNAILIGSGTLIDNWFHVGDDATSTRGANLAAITRDVVTDPAVMNVDRISELPLCGFSEEWWLGDKTSWFIPTRACLEGWLRASGFQVDDVWQFTWSIPGFHRTAEVTAGALQFRGRLVAAPKREYELDDYERIFGDRTERSEVYEFAIPTSGQVRRLGARIAELEAQVAELKRPDDR